MTDFDTVAFRDYISALVWASSLDEIDNLMFKASEDTDINNRAFLLLSFLSRELIQKQGFIS